MTTAAMQHAQQDGTAFATHFYRHFTFPWPDPAVPAADATERRTTGRWDTGTYRPAVMQHMRTAFAEALDAEGERVGSTWTDPALQKGWRDAASAEYGRLLNEVARFSAPTSSAGPA